MSGGRRESGGGIHGLVLAAGAGRRFGAGAKQLAPLGGRPLLEHALAAMAAAPELAGVVVTLGARAEQIAAAVDLHRAKAVVVDGWEEGIAASLRAGVAALPADAEAVVVALGDQPRLEPAAIARLVAAARSSDAVAVRATHAGRPGHPVLLRRELFGALGELRGDRGAGALLGGVAVLEVECGPGAVLDVDRPADLP